MGIFTAKQEIGPDTVLQRKQDMLFNEIDGEVVMLSIENSEYYGMDKVGSSIWRILEKPIFFKELIDCLLQRYEVTKEQCTKDTLVFLHHLEDKNLIIID